MVEVLLTHSFVQTVGWMLIHFLWQGTVIALSLAAVNAALRRNSANVRYFASCAALLLMFVMPLVTLWLVSKPASPAQDINVVSITSDGSEAASLPQFESQTPLEDYRMQSGSLSSMTQQTEPPRILSLFTNEMVSSLLPWLTSLWLAGVVLLSLRMFGGWLYTWRLLSRRTSMLGEVWQQMLHRLCQQLRVSRPVRIVQSALVQVPTAIGWLRPVILIPVSALAGLTPRQLEAIIAHELAHIRRYDYLVNLIQTAVEILLFYHPAVWWVSRQARIEREHCCDDVAVEVCGDVLTYARALSEIEELRSTTPQLVMAANGGVLLGRIQRLIGAAPRSPYEPAPWMGALIAFALVFLLAAGSRVDLFSTSAQPLDLSESREAIAVSNLSAPSNRQSIFDQTPEVASTDKAKDKLQKQELPETDNTAEEKESLLIDGVTESLSVIVIDQDQESNYVGELAALGYTGLTVDQLIKLKNHGISPAFIREIKAAGYTDLKVEDLIRLAQHAVSAKYIMAMKDAGFGDLSVDTIIRMRSHAVSAEFAKGIKEAGFKDATPDQVIKAASHAVTLEYVKEMRAVGYTSASLDELIRARDHALSPEFIKAVRDKGFENLTLDQLIRLKANAVGPDYISELRSLGVSSNQVDDVIRAANHAVTPEFIREIRGLGYTDISLNQIMRLRNNAVTPEYIKELKQAGFNSLSVDQVIRLRNNAVTPAYIRDLKQAGYDNLSVEEVVRLRNNLVSAEFIRKAKAQGIQNLTVEQLIRLRNAGIFN